MRPHACEETGPPAWPVYYIGCHAQVLSLDMLGVPNVAQLQVRRPACITITFSPPVSQPDPARMTCLGARLPQERVGFFILDVRKATKTLVVDVLLNVQIGTPCTEDAGVV